MVELGSETGGFGIEILDLERMSGLGEAEVGFASDGSSFGEAVLVDFAMAGYVEIGSERTGSVMAGSV